MPAQTQVKAEIDQRIDCLLRASNDSQGRYEHARDAGAALAAVVYAFTEDPESVGTDALRSAYATFMGQHAGNFAPVG